MLVATAALCLALNVWHEARSETEAGQIAVAYVTINRSVRSGRSICAEVFAPGQFSWTAARRSPPTSSDTLSWLRAFRIAVLSLNSVVADSSRGATHFTMVAAISYNQPCWVPAFKHTVTIGSHAFYRAPLGRVQPLCLRKGPPL